MTREEAIEHLKEWKECISSAYRRQVIDMAIEALQTDVVQGNSCDGCRYTGIIEKCELCRRLYTAFDDLYKGGEDE